MTFAFTLCSPFIACEDLITCLLELFWASVGLSTFSSTCFLRAGSSAFLCALSGLHMRIKCAVHPGFVDNAVCPSLSSCPSVVFL